MTFIVNHNGKIFEKDLGQNTGAVAAEDHVVRPRARLAGHSAVKSALPFPPFPVLEEQE